MVVLRVNTVDYVTLFSNRQPDDNLNNITYQLENQTVLVSGHSLKNGETIITNEQSANHLVDVYNPVLQQVNDTTPPTLATAVIGPNGDNLFLTFSERINVNPWLVTSFFTLSISGSPITLTFAGGHGTHHLNFLTFAHTIIEGETATLAYTPGDVVDLSGNQLAAFSGFSVTNTSTQQRVAPIVESFVVDTSGSLVNILFSEPVTGGTTGFSVTASGGALNVIYAGGSGTSTWTYTVSRTIGSHETLTYSYDVAAAIKDSDNNLLAAITDEAVTNDSTADIVVPTLESATLAEDGETLTVVFSEAVSGVFGDPAVAAEIVSPATSLVVTYVSGNATDTHTYTIFRRALSAEDVTITGGGAFGLIDGSGNAVPMFTDFAVTNNSTQQIGATVETFNSNDTWTCPADVHLARIELWGGGGGGGGHSFSSGGGGGGGGAYSMMVVGVVPDDDYTVTVGTAGTAGSTFSSGGSGGDSTFTDQSFSINIITKGGSGGSGFSSSGGSGGQLFGNGDVRFVGGNGGNAPSSSLGGGGGGAAGSNGNGGNASGATAGIAGTGGGDGGAGGNNVGGSAGTAPGGGGGGTGNSSNNGGAGTAGRIKITY